MNSSNLEIRSATREDIAAWRRMRSTLWTDCTDADNEIETEAYFTGGDFKLVLLAMSGVNAIGFAEISERNIVDGCDGGPAAYLEGWYVDAAHRRKGVGKALIDAAARWAREQGYIFLGSDVELENLISQTAHSALGFEETGRVVTYRMRVG